MVKELPATRRKEEKTLKNGATGRQNGPSYCLITRRDAANMDVLILTFSDGEMVLPVFSFEDEARMFLEIGKLGGWRVRETSDGELISALCGPCASVRKVVLDPLPGLDGEGMNDLLSMEREAFMESLLNMQWLQVFGPGRSTMRRQDRGRSKASTEQAQDTCLASSPTESRRP